MLSDHLILFRPLLLLPQSFPASGSFPMSQFFTPGGQSTGVSASASVLPVNIQDWFPLGLTETLEKRLNRSQTKKHQWQGRQTSSLKKRMKKWKVQKKWRVNTVFSESSCINQAVFAAQFHVDWGMKSFYCCSPELGSRPFFFPKSPLGKSWNPSIDNQIERMNLNNQQTVINRGAINIRKWQQMGRLQWTCSLSYSIPFSSTY